MLRRSGLRLGSQLLRAAAACGQAASEQLAARITTFTQTPGPAISDTHPTCERASSRQPWQLRPARAASGGAGSGGGSSSEAASSGHGSGTRQKPGPKTHTAEPQPQLQAWLEQQQGLPAAAADKLARRLAYVFGGSQQAALEGLPAAFNFCARQGLTGLETARLLERMAAVSHTSVIDFASTAQHNWLLIDGCIAAHVQRQRQAGERLPKHATFGAVAGRWPDRAAAALAGPPGQVEAWLTGVGQRLPAEDIGRLLLGIPETVYRTPATALAAMAWAVDELGVPAEEVAPFMAGNPRLLGYPVSTISANLAALQQVLQQPGPPEQHEQRQQAAAELAQRLARKHSRVLTANSGTVRAASAWLQQLFRDPARLNALLERGPALLAASAERLERNAAYLQQELGWQPGDGQLAAFIDKHPQPFAQLDLASEKAQLMLRFLTSVVGVAPTDCLAKYSTYLARSLETTAARYMLLQERAPQLLFDRGGTLSLSWAINAPVLLLKLGAATKAELLTFEREWPRSEEGRRLLAALRSGSTEGWPRPGAAQKESEQLADAPPRQARERSGSGAQPQARRQRRQAGRQRQSG